MPLIFCYECSKEISDKAPACPHCGAPAKIRSDHVEEPQVTQHQAIETEQQEELAPEPVSETPKKDEPFNQIVALAVGALVFQIVRSLGISLGALSVVFMIVPIVLLVRYVKKQTTQVYAGIIGVLVVVMGIAVAAGPGDVFVPQAVTTQDAPQNRQTDRSANVVDSVTYRDNGRLRQEGQYVNGREEGRHNIYENGNLLSWATWSKGRKNGPYENYHHPNGGKSAEGTFRDGVRHGVTSRYHENGELDTHIEYVNGEITSIYR